MKNERLFSLDLLRGLDMFLLTVVGPLVYVLNGWLHFPEGVMRQFEHFWGCFTLWDIIMPLFIFMCGAAVPLALPKRLEADGHAGARYWGHVFGRVALLWFFGLLCQGQLATLDPLRISPFTNTLQAIAVGYLIAACVLLIPSRKVQVAMPILMAAAYGIALAAWGDYTKDGNLAQVVEQKFLHLVLPAESKSFGTGGYTWVLTSLMFGAMTLCGSEATRILTSEGDPWKKALRLAGLGAALLVAGLALEPFVPCLKHVYSVSFTAQAMGYCALALAALYVLTDIWKFRRGLWLFILFGQTALAAYMLSGFFGAGPDAVAGRIVQGWGNMVHAPSGAFVHVLVRSILLAYILFVWRRFKQAR